MSRPSCGIGATAGRARPQSLDATPKHGLVAVDHRLAQRALDIGDRLDLRRIGATEKNAIGFRPVVLAGEFGPFPRRDRGEFERLARERHVMDDDKAAGMQIVDHGLVALVGAEHDQLSQSERLQRFEHEPTCCDRLDAAGFTHDVQYAAFALRALRHRSIRAVKDDKVGRDIREQLCRGGDLVGHHRERTFPFTGDAGARDMHPEPGRGETIELGLGHAVDGRNDHSDPRAWRGQRELSISRVSIVVTTFMLLSPKWPVIGSSIRHRGRAAPRTHIPR